MILINRTYAPGKNCHLWLYDAHTVIKLPVEYLSLRHKGIYQSWDLIFVRSIDKPFSNIIDVLYI